MPFTPLGQPTLFKIAPGDFVSGGSDRLPECDGVGLGLGALATRLKCGNDPVDDLQDGGEQLGMCCEEATKRDRKRQHPFAHRQRRQFICPSNAWMSTSSVPASRSLIAVVEIAYLDRRICA